MNNQRGFVLATSIWMIAITLVLGALFHGYVESQVTKVMLVREQLQRSVEIRSTEQSLLYIMGTRRVTRAGFTMMPAEQAPEEDSDGNFVSTPTGNEIRVDGRPFYGIGCGRFRIQDQAGLIGLNNPQAQPWLEELFSRSREVSTNSLVAALADYVDGDNRRRIGGAERADYVRARQLGPSNQSLRSDYEIFSVLGWNNWLGRESNADWSDWVDIGTNNRYNVNTAPAGLLALLLDLGPGELGLLEQLRDDAGFRSLDGVAETLRRLNVWPPERFRFYPSTRFKLELWCDGSNSSTVHGLQLTPRGLLGPWLTDYRYRKAHVRNWEPAQTVHTVAGSLFTDALPADG